jgi:hypothetical protein
MIYYKIYSQNHNNFYNYIQTLWYKNIYKENTFYKQTVCFYIADKNIQMSTQSLLKCQNRILCNNKWGYCLFYLRVFLHAPVSMYEI